MAPLIIGMALVALGVFDYRRQAVPDDAVGLTGTVTREVASRSRIAGRSAMQYAPVIAYAHPSTGRTEELEPTRFGSSRYTPGEVLQLAYSPSTGQVVRVPERRWATPAVLVLLALVLIGLQLLDWTR